MSYLKDFLDTLDNDERELHLRLMAMVKAIEPGVVEGLSYGLPAYKLNGRPLIGFGKNKFGLSIYPFDPRVIRAVRDQLPGFEVGKGVIRHTTDMPVPETVFKLMVELRLDFLEK